MKPIYYTILAIALFSCKKEPQAPVALSEEDSIGLFRDIESVADSSLTATTHCYADTKSMDSIYVSIEDNLGTITGKMAYNNYEKENVYGELVGYSSGDTVKVDFSFVANNQESTKEIWFLKKEDKLIQAVGKYDNLNQKYINPKTISFDEGKIFYIVDCKEVNNIFK